MTSPRQPHRLDSLTAQQINGYRLPDSGLGRRGYDKQAVDTALGELAEYIDALRMDLAAVTRSLRYREEEIQLRRYGIHLPTDRSGDLIHEEQLTWHLEAQRYGDQITAVAQVQAGHIVEDAQAHAYRILAATEDRLGTTQAGDPHRLELLQSTLHTMRQLLAQVEQNVDRVDAMAADWAQGAAG